MRVIYGFYPDYVGIIFVWGVPKIMGPFFGVPIIVVVNWGLYWGPLTPKP